MHASEPMARCRLDLPPTEAATHLCTCVFDCNVPLLRRFIKAGAMVNCGNFDARTALHVAAAEGNLAAVRAFPPIAVPAACWVEPEEHLAEEWPWSQSCIFPGSALPSAHFRIAWPCKGGHVLGCVQVRVLVEEGKAELGCADRWGSTPLDEAMRMGARPVMDYLQVTAALPWCRAWH